MEKIPQRKHGIVNRAQNTLFAYQGWPSVCRDENGVLYAVASGMRLSHVCPFGKTVMYISRNNGKTWTPPIIVNDDYVDDRDAGILYMGNGRMLVTWFCHSVESYENRYYSGMVNGRSEFEKPLMVGMLDSYKHVPDEFTHGGSFVRVSEDYGVTWSESIRVPVSSPHGPTMLKDGSLLYLGKDMYINNDDTNMDGHIRAYSSTDGGYSWIERAIIPTPDGIPLDAFHEPHAIELPDGRILGLIRAEGDTVTPSFTMFQTESTDGGYTWTMPKNLGIDGSPPHLMLHSSGALICSYGRRKPPFSERAMVSYDLGKTWADDYVIDDRPSDWDLGYPSTVEIDGGNLLTVYYQKYEDDKKCSILCTEWRL